jgi:hypothetical protein
MEFEKSWAYPNNVKPDFNKHFEFLRYDSKYGKDGDILISKVEESIDLIPQDAIEKMQKNVDKDRKGHERGIIFEGEHEVAAFNIDEEVELKDFPPTISFALNNDFIDGKKRAVFLLLTFLHSIKWDKEHIRSTIEEWNSKQSEPLKKNYLNAQIVWFENQEKVISPPNYNNANYYKSIGITEQKVFEDKSKLNTKINVKNPLHYIYLYIKSKNKGDKKTK